MVWISNSTIARRNGPPVESLKVPFPQKGKGAARPGRQLPLFYLASNFLAFDYFLPLRANLFPQFRRGLGHRRELFHPFKRAAGVDHGAGVKAFFARMNSVIPGPPPH